MTIGIICAMEKEIKKYISDVYNLEDARIYVVRR